MKDALFIGIDIGTQGTKAVLCHTDGSIADEAFCPSLLCRPDSETVYEEPENIFSSVITVISELTARAGEEAESIRAIGIDSQMAGIMGIDRDFNVSIPLDSWLDSRCADFTELLKKEAGDEALKYSGGQYIHAHAPKILWWKHKEPQAYENTFKFIEPNCYAAGKLCGLSADDAFIDYTFLHFNVFSDNQTCRFRDDMILFFGVEPQKMPRIVPPETIVGTVTEEYSELCGLPHGVQIIAGCGDTAASSLGAGITRSGLAYDVAGTASVFACCTESFVPDIANKTLLFSRSVIKDLFLPLSYINGGGLCLEWFSKITGRTLRELDKAAEKRAETETIFIPHFSGRTFPLDNRVSGAFLGLNQCVDSADMHKAVMESVAFEYKHYYDILCRSGCIKTEPTVIGVGGGAKSPLFSQIKSDVLGVSYITPQKTDSAPVASALLAAHAVGFIDGELSDIFKPRTETGTLYRPDGDAQRRYDIKANKYLRLLERYGDYITE